MAVLNKGGVYPFAGIGIEIADVTRIANITDYINPGCGWKR
jgi:hypothetical protein